MHLSKAYREDRKKIVRIELEAIARELKEFQEKQLKLLREDQLLSLLDEFEDEYT